MSSKKTPFYDVESEYGANFGEVGGYLMPLEYPAGCVEEHIATRERATVCDFDLVPEFEVEGNGALDLVQYVFTCDAVTVPIGGILYGAMCTEEGGMLDDGLIWRMDAEKYTLTIGNEGNERWILQNAERFDASVRNVTSDHTILALQGPLSHEVLRRVTGSCIEGMHYGRFIEGAVAGVDCTIARLGYTGEFGYELHFDPAHAEVLWRSLFDAGEVKGLLPLGMAAVDSLRQEAGYILAGCEFDRARNPFEAGIGAVVSMQKKDFCGKEALAAVLRDGVKRSLVWLRLDDSGVAATGDAVSNGRREVGRVTSGSYSPMLQRGIALAQIDPEFAISGAVFTIESEDGGHTARVSLMPFWDAGDANSKRPSPLSMSLR